MHGVGLSAGVCLPVYLHSFEGFLLLSLVVAGILLSEPKVASSLAGRLAELSCAVELVWSLTVSSLAPARIVGLRRELPAAAFAFPLATFLGRFGVFRLHGAPPSARSIAETSVDGRQEAFWAAQDSDRVLMKPQRSRISGGRTAI